MDTARQLPPQQSARNPPRDRAPSRADGVAHPACAWLYAGVCRACDEYRDRRAGPRTGGRVLSSAGSATCFLMKRMSISLWMSVWSRLLLRLRESRASRSTKLTARSSRCRPSPFASGIKGGIAGGIAMVIPAELYGIIRFHSIWYVVNLLGGAGVGGWTNPTMYQLTHFRLSAFITANIIQGATTLLVGILYGAMLPIWPKRPDPARRHHRAGAVDRPAAQRARHRESLSSAEDRLVVLRGLAGLLRCGRRLHGDPAWQPEEACAGAFGGAARGGSPRPASRRARTGTRTRRAKRGAEAMRMQPLVASCLSLACCGAHRLPPARQAKAGRRSAAARGSDFVRRAVRRRTAPVATARMGRMAPRPTSPIPSTRR